MNAEESEIDENHHENPDAGTHSDGGEPWSIDLVATEKLFNLYDNFNSREQLEKLQVAVIGGNHNSTSHRAPRRWESELVREVAEHHAREATSSSSLSRPRRLSSTSLLALEDSCREDEYTRRRKP